MQYGFCAGFQWFYNGTSCLSFVEDDINLNVQEFIFGINLLNLEEMLLEERKRKRRCEFECTDHIFMLEALKSNPSKYDIELQFCPKYQREPLPPERTYPEFNDDYLYYTSAFVLGVDKRLMMKNQQQQLIDHQKQIRDSLQKHNQLVFPRPNSKHSLCSVCKEHYKNYYIHIASEEHRTKIGMSPYNTHIKDLCYQFIHLWQGAQERADEQAEKRAIEQQERRQRLAEEKLQQQQLQEQSNSLLDCQRGQPQEQQQEEEQEFMRRAKNNRKYQRSAFNNEDTVPLNSKAYKRSAPDKSLYQPPIRKRYTAGQFNPTHAARERKERQYERERDKMMRGTEFEFFKRHYRARPGQQNDVFIVMEPIEGQNEQINQPPKTAQNQKAKKAVVQEPIKKKQQLQRVQSQLHKVKEPVMRQNESVEEKRKESRKQIAKEWKNQQPQAQKQIRERKQVQHRKISHEEGELSNSQSQSFSNDSRSGSKDNLTIKKHPTNHRQEYPESKLDPRMQGYPYHYPPMPMHTAHYPHKNQQLTPEQYNQAYKGAYNQYAENYKNYPESHKGMPPYYYHPYNYPMYDQFYMRPPPNEKVYQNNPDKEKNKLHDKPYEYPMPYHWPYHPYYMPPMPPIPPMAEQKTEHITSNSVKTSTNIKGNSTREHPSNPYSGNTSININFPMYMFPPPHPSMPGYSMPPNRFPPTPSAHPMMNPYMGYPYGPYTNQQQRNERQRESPPTHPSKSKEVRYHASHNPSAGGYTNYNAPPQNGGYQSGNVNQNVVNRGHGYNYPYSSYNQYAGHFREQQKSINKQV